MSDDSCTSCNHPANKHNPRGGCMNTKPGASGKAVSCGCGWSGKNHKESRWVELESRKFLADNQDCLDDRHELLTRATKFAELNTNGNRPVTAAFVAKIHDLHTKRPKVRTASVNRPLIQDFPDELMY